MSTDRSEFVQSLERGLAVIRSFDADRPSMTLTEVARETGLTRATARRVLMTLETLGYASSGGRQFSLTPRVLDIGYAYLSSLDLAAIAQTEMEALVDQTHESCSAAVLDGGEIVYVVRVPTKRIMTVSLGLGSRLPAHATSMGRVLLADLPTAALGDHLPDEPWPELTTRTITSRDALLTELRHIRGQGWALVDQELEDGVRSVAAPLRDRTGRAIAALNVSSHAGRISLATLRDVFLPELLATAERISNRLRRR